MRRYAIQSIPLAVIMLQAILFVAVKARVSTALLYLLLAPGAIGWVLRAWVGWVLCVNVVEGMLVCAGLDGCAWVAFCWCDLGNG